MTKTEKRLTASIHGLTAHIEDLSAKYDARIDHLDDLLAQRGEEIDDLRASEAEARREMLYWKRRAFELKSENAKLRKGLFFSIV